MTMTQPSLATQKVQAAFWKDVQHIENVDEFNLAAALRALVCTSLVEETMIQGWVCKAISCEDILNVSAELEAL